MKRGMLAVLLLGACKREQSFDDAMHVLCDLPRTVDAGDAVELARAAERLVTNPEVSAWMGSTTPRPREQRDAEIAAMLRRAGITDCWLSPP